MLSKLLSWLERKRVQSLLRLQGCTIARTGVPSQEMETKQLLELGNAELDQGNLHNAFELYKAALKREPQNINAQVNLAFVQLEVGDTGAAAQHLQTVLSKHPNHVDALFLSSKLHEAEGRLLAAIEHLKVLLDANERFEYAYPALSRNYVSNGQTAEAESVVRRGLELFPDNFDLQIYSGNFHRLAGEFDLAEAVFRRLASQHPAQVQPKLNLAKLKELQGHTSEALDHYRTAAKLQPASAELQFRLGNLHQQCGRFVEAAACYEHSLKLDSTFVDSLANLSSVLIFMGQYEPAIRAAEDALRLRPDDANTCNNLGIALIEMGRTKDAKEAFLRALRINESSIAAMCNLASAYLARAELELAIKQYRSVLDLDPLNLTANSNLLFALNYHPDLSAQEIFNAYRQFNTRLMEGIPQRTALAIAPIHCRRLRVGYVSPDFRNHSVMRFFEPVLQNHDKDVVETFAYSGVVMPDEKTEFARARFDHWCDTVTMSDDDLARQIESDGIDVLVDLAGHTQNNRLRVFAFRPAPVSMTWMGYGYTTGLSSIDYFLADKFCVPIGSEDVFAEAPWRLNRPFWAFRPMSGMGEVGNLPVLTNGYVTFVSLTRPVRVNHRLVRVWSELLMRLPNARLKLDSKGFLDTEAAEKVALQFIAHGVERHRLEIGYHSPPWDLLRASDISLDCFPHNSGTTLFESLYMGTPFVTLAGRPSVGCLGASILMGLGRSEWIASSEQEYIDIAIGLASDCITLATLRAGLREEMKQSCLMDEIGFTRALESAYVEMFHKWTQVRDQECC